ncbi:hypothetical protein FE257_011568 [Aspergillus nanangensis]|uniref:Zn(2)-C6 fungal-type domain-containing protein n=1 Tax=Aspergillus nanangensis TaxID=2582783 RepID=A0AAD4CH09_ASPNN|nr:hypothetical protein FE257_011568 [Aspergillus nanangensis]
MPGILPMKVIKVGGAQSRIAQACDRCRSKKIRCDGVRPCCSQCANVGFECKTSDKLSRRAFPRGYTESLEERVRSLEAEVRDLKDLLDEKDEKIDVLSRIHSFSPSSQQKAATSARSPPAPAKPKPTTTDAGEGVIPVPLPSDSTESDESQNSISSARGFSDTFINKLKQQGRLPPNLSTQALTVSPPAISHSRLDQAIKTAPRLVTDQLINIFFQEWAPLYPVVHRPTILKAYEQYVSSTDSLQGNKHNLTQLNLIFGIAALASTSRTNQDPVFFEDNWSPTLESLSGDISISTLQCYVLAQMYCMTKADYTSLLRYRSLAISLCHQMRLHQSQKCRSSNPLVGETRKKVFWCQYVLDRFTAALTGLPVLLREEDVRTEFPEDIDDENVTETGFLPTLPGESTRISSALAFFAAARILNRALENLYPSDGGYEIPVSKMRSVAGHLDDWVKNLPSHLRLEFSQDKPSTNVTSSRSPLLLLDERRLCLSISINRRELVYSCGLGLLWQNIGLKRDSKLLKEGQKILSTIIDQLESLSSPAAAEFSALATVLVSLDSHKHASSNKPQAMSPPVQKPFKSPKKHFQALKSRFTPNGKTSEPSKPESQSRRATVSESSPHPSQRHVRSSSWTSLPSDNYHGLPVSMDKHGYYTSPSMGYLNGPAVSNSAPSDAIPGNLTPADWELVLGDMDRGYSNIFTGIYGGKECGEDHGPFASLTAEYTQKPDELSVAAAMPGTQNDLQGLSPEAWSASSHSDIVAHQAPQSVLSYSDESLVSLEDSVPFNELHPSSEGQTSMLDPFQGVMIPSLRDDIDEFGLANGWDRRLAV